MGRSRWIERWDPEDDAFWEASGQKVARRNLALSIFAEFLGFSVWQLWAVVAVQLASAGFDLTGSQRFTLVAVPGLIGATMRFPYGFAPALVGGRNWTVVSALALLVPVTGLSAVVGSPETPYWVLLVVAGTAGLGGGNFASSMANISYFYPERRKGLALGLNAAGGNLGVAVVLLVGPAVITVGSLGLGGTQDGGRLSLQNAGLVWIPFILAAAALAWFGMDNLATAKSTFKEQRAVVRHKHTWIMAWLYVGAFGSFIGYSAGLPLLISQEFPRNDVKLAFLGPLVGSVARPFGGWLADRVGGARVTLATFGAMTVATLGVTYCLSQSTASWAFAGFLGGFVILFVLAGLANGSTFRMVPAIFRTEMEAAAGADAETRAGVAKRARAQAAATMGFISAVAAYGGFLVPQSYGLSTSVAGGPEPALLVFSAFYVTCMGVTWWHYLRRSFAVHRAPSLAPANV